jgi:hypothetical protein
MFLPLFAFELLLLSLRPLKQLPSLSVAYDVLLLLVRPLTLASDQFSPAMLLTVW